jgi:Tol biopolymer transport system component
MAPRESERQSLGSGWKKLALLAVLALALASCGDNQVDQPELTGTVWTMLSPVSFDDCLWPDVFGDSLIYSTTALVPVSSTEQGFRGRIIVSGVDGKSPFMIRYLGAANWNNLRPRWVGRQKIVFMDNRAGNYDIWYKSLETLAEYRLTKFSTNETAPVPRPGTAGLVYVELSPAATTAYDYGRLVLIPDTTAVPLERIYLTPDTLLCGDPDWDPTGTTLCYTRTNNADFTRHIYKMRLAPGDSLPVQLTTGPTHDFQPRWSPDGGRIAFTSDRSARSGIWVVSPEGESKGLVLVSFDDTGAAVYSPTWLPDGTGLIVSSNGRSGVRGLWLVSNLPAFGF